MAEEPTMTDCFNHAHDCFTLKETLWKFINGKDGPAEEKLLCLILNAVSVSTLKDFKNASPIGCEGVSENVNERARARETE